MAKPRKRPYVYVPGYWAGGGAPQREDARTMRRKAYAAAGPMLRMEIERLFYRKAMALTQRTGIRHEVDHIVPIVRGGKHHPDNLRVIAASENRRKADRMPYPEELPRRAAAPSPAAPSIFD